MYQHLSIVQVIYDIRKLLLHCLQAVTHKDSMRNFPLLDFT